MEHLKNFLLLYVRPARALSGLLDEGNLIIAVLLALAVSLGLHGPAMYSSYTDEMTQVAKTFEEMKKNPPPPNAEYEGQPEVQLPGLPPGPQTPPLRKAIESLVAYSAFGTFGNLLGLAAIFVPALIGISVLTGSQGSFATVFLRDYLALVLLTFSAWAAAFLPIALGGIVQVFTVPSGERWILFWCLAGAGFLFLCVHVVRTMYGSGYGQAIPTVGGAAAVLFVIEFVQQFAGGLSFYFLSPFYLYYAYLFFQGDVTAMRYSFSARRSFRRYLEASLINPRDSDAHYQLGLIYMQRRRIDAAAEAFRKALAIRDDETDAHLQLAKILREQGKFEDASRHAQAVLKQDEKHSLSEAWREFGVAQFLLGNFSEAVSALEKYTSRRPYEPEGLYYFGLTLQKAGRKQDAKETFQQAVEAVDTAPRNRRGAIRKWRGLAKDALRAL